MAINAMRDFVTAFPTSIWQRGRAPHEDIECSICQEQIFSTHVFRQLPCHVTHKFHATCIQTWVNTRQSNPTPCPMCRAPFTTWKDERGQESVVRISRSPNEATELRQPPIQEIRLQDLIDVGYVVSIAALAMLLNSLVAKWLATTGLVAAIGVSAHVQYGNIFSACVSTYTILTLFLRQPRLIDCLLDTVSFHALIIAVQSYALSLGFLIGGLIFANTCLPSFGVIVVNCVVLVGSSCIFLVGPHIGMKIVEIHLQRSSQEEKLRALIAVVRQSIHAIVLVISMESCVFAGTLVTNSIYLLRFGGIGLSDSVVVQKLLILILGCVVIKKAVNVGKTALENMVA